jgi:hypothetical protein
MKKVLTAIFILGISVPVYSQQMFQDAVYLKNGVIMRGRIIEVIPHKQLTLETLNRVVLVYQFDEVAKYYQRTYPGTIKQSKSKPVKAPKRSCSFSLSGLKKGNSRIVELGYARGYGTGYLNFYKLNIIGTHRLNQHFSVGIGTGCRYYPLSSVGKSSSGWMAAYGGHSVSLSSSIVIPFFTDLRVNIIDNKVSPYFSIGMGYSFVAAKKDTLFAPWVYPPAYPSVAFFEAEQTGLYQGGFLLNPSLGVCFKISRKCAVNVSIGYEMQRATVHSREKYSMWYDTGHGLHGGNAAYFDKLTAVNSSRISINSGISF